MTPPWERVKEVVAEALERRPEERAAYLDAACGDDSAFRHEAESLIAAAEKGTPLDESPFAHVSNPSALFDSATARETVTSASSAVPRAREHLGPYRVVQELGRGGMGSVYLAVRDDDQYKKRVAVKLLRHGVETEDIVKRFRNERQISASIDHPYVAKLLDGGSTEEGLPYFVMEYVEGRPIDEYCDSRKFSITERLVLFRKVCAAVHFAHQNLVVHRDLKPGNILVTADATPKLLDFGIAKLLNPELAAHTVDPTRFEMRLMTPEYASPEQVRGDAITTASDVYSLGVLLYELLTGHKPYRLKSRQLVEIARAICEEEPARPSTMVDQVEEVPGPEGTARQITPETVSKVREGTAERLRRRLRGDLDNIVLMAMRKEPHRRYASVEQLSEDVRRYIDGLPIKARKGTWLYKGSKFVRRHRVGLGAVAAFLVALVGFTALTVLERAQAEREAAKARAVVGFLTATLAAIDPRVSLGEEPTVRDMLYEAERGLRLKHDVPFAEEAAIRKTIAESHFQLGHLKEARDQYAQLLTRASSRFGESDADTLEVRVGLAAAQVELGEVKEAEQNARVAIGRLEERRNPPAKLVVRARSTLVRVLIALGTRDHLKEAEEVLAPAAHLARADLGPLDLERWEVFELLTQIKLAQDRFTEAEPLARENYGAAKAELGPHHPVTLEAFNTLSSCLLSLSRYSDVLEMQRQHVDDARRVLGEDHLRTLRARETLAETLRRLDRFEESRGIYEDVLARKSRLLGSAHRSTLNSRHHIALLQKDLKKAKKAEEMLREIALVQRQTFGPNDAGTLASELMIALTLFQQGNWQGSRDAYAEVLPRIKESYGESWGGYLVGMSNYAGLLYRLGDHAGAERLFRESLAAHKRVYGDHYFGTYYTMMELGTTLVHLERYSEAEDLLLGALDGFRAIFRDQPSHQRIRSTLGRIIRLYEAWKQKDRVDHYKTLLEKASETRPKPTSSSHPLSTARLARLSHAGRLAPLHEPTKQSRSPA